MQKQNTMYVGHHYAHTHTINVNKTCALQQTTDKTGIKSSIRTKFKQRHIGNSQSVCCYNMHWYCVSDEYCKG
jgi:hypothetical protein